MTSGEGSLWLRECLAAKDIEILDDIVLPTTHSCKATLLSWIAKSGKFDMSERQIMGHHLDRPSVSALTYGRQNFIPILTKVALLLRKINDGSFSPDAQVSRIVRQSLAQMAAESQQFSEQMGLKPRLEEADDSASEADDQEDIEIAVTKVVPPDELRQVAVDVPSKYEQHRLSGVIHMIMDEGRFAFGRVRSLNYLSCEPSSIFWHSPLWAVQELAFCNWGAVTDCARRKVKILSGLQHGFVATVAVFLRGQLVQDEVHLMFAV